MLVREHGSKEHQRQKEFYDAKVHGEPYKIGDFVWLHLSPPKGTSHKLHHPWTGPYKVIKKVSDVTYQIQHLYGNRQCKVIHFDRLKPCSREVIQSLQHSRPMPVEPTIYQSTCHSSQDLIVELLDDYDDDAELQLPPLSTADSVRRYPTRTHHPPSRFSDFDRH